LSHNALATPEFDFRLAIHTPAGFSATMIFDTAEFSTTIIFDWLSTLLLDSQPPCASALDYFSKLYGFPPTYFIFAVMIIEFLRNSYPGQADSWNY